MTKEVSQQYILSNMLFDLLGHRLSPPLHSYVVLRQNRALKIMLDHNIVDVLKKELNREAGEIGNNQLNEQLWQILGHHPISLIKKSLKHEA